MQLVRDTPQKDNIPEILQGLKGIKSLDPIRGVYFLFLNEEIVYIGQSSNVYSRVHQHVRLKEKDFNRVFYQEVPHDMDILAVEKHYILKFRPKYNYETSAKSCERPITVDEAAYYLKRVEQPALRPDHVFLQNT